MQVPFFDWKSLYLEKEGRVFENYFKNAKKGAFILQADVSNFEKNCNFLDIKHVSCGCGWNQCNSFRLRASGVG